MRTFLLGVDENHAEILDQLVFARLQTEEGAQGVGWSGVWTDGQRFGILWEAPVSDLFGLPEDFPELVLVEDVAGEWTFALPSNDGPEESPV